MPKFRPEVKIPTRGMGPLDTCNPHAHLTVKLGFRQQPLEKLRPIHSDVRPLPSENPPDPAVSLPDRRLSCCLGPPLHVGEDRLMAELSTQDHRPLLKTSRLFLLMFLDACFLLRPSNLRERPGLQDPVRLQDQVRVLQEPCLKADFGTPDQHQNNQLRTAQCEAAGCLCPPQETNFTGRPVLQNLNSNFSINNNT